MFGTGGGKVVNTPTTLFNKYKPGSGVGINSISTRRAKNRLSTICSGGSCFQGYNRLGLYSKNPNGFVPDRFPDPPNPDPDTITGYVTFYFDFTGTEPPSPELIEAILPFITISDIFEITYTTTITSNRVSITIETVLYDETYEGIFGFTFDKTYIPPDTSGPPIPLTDFYNTTENLTLVTCIDCPFTTIGSQFKGLTDPFTIESTFIPYFLVDTSLQDCFLNCSNFNSDISFWDTTNIINMASMFKNAPLFNQAIHSWNTFNVTDMSSMFENPNAYLYAFNQNIGGWDVSNVTNMSYMFSKAGYFNNGGSADIQNWNAHKCTNFSSMFQNAYVFNQPLPTLVDTSTVAGCTLSEMFSSASVFNQNIGGWIVTNVTNTDSMFFSAYQFNNGGSPTIQTWTAPKCTDFSSMFRNAFVFNQPLPTLVDTSNVSICNLSYLFLGSSIFNQNIGGWIVTNVTNMDSMFLTAYQFNNGGSPTIQTWTAPKCTDFSSMFLAAYVFNQPLPSLVDTSNVSTCTLYQMFSSASVFNQNIGGWIVNNVTNMSYLFSDALVFNNGDSDSIQTWTAPKCTDFSNMFQNAFVFNQPLPSLVDTSNVSSCVFTSMFSSAYQFNKNIGGWIVTNATNMSSMFNNARVFNNAGSNTIQTWTAPKCTDFSIMFQNTFLFNQPLPTLVDTSNVSSCNISQMFTGSSIFNKNIGGWIVTNATNMSSMFSSAYQFNNGGSDSIQTWSAYKCTTFSSMFNTASAFNQPLPSLINTSTVSSCSLGLMFQNASLFDQDIGGWNVTNATNMSSMFQYAVAFNNAGYNTIQTWRAPICTTFTNMFSNAVSFNQPLPILVDTSTIFTCTLNTMFQNASLFNQNIGGWIVTNASNMSFMFQNAVAFNNAGSNTIQTWNVIKCNNYSSMFQNAISFNQPLLNLVNTSTISSCTFNSMFNNASLFNQNIGSWNTANSTNIAAMFQGALSFNNGELGYVSISGLNPTGSTYTNSSQTLVCPVALFLTTLTAGDVLIIQTSSIIYSSSIQSITNDTTLILTTAYGTNILSGIISITKQIPGSSPLNWNTANVTSAQNAFNGAVFFNQNITTNGNIWNTTKVTNASTMFAGTATSRITLFNNGQLITGTTAPMGWTFASGATLTNFRLNCRLTSSNKPTSVS